MNGNQAFAHALDFVLSREGGYVHDPRDPGGETNFGISQRAYPYLDIKALTRERAAEIYHRDYWAALGADMFAPAIAAQLFDHAVNAGVTRSVQVLQNAINLACIVGRPLVVDGVMGPNTVRAATASCTPGAPDLTLVSGRIALERVGYYLDITERNAGLRVYLRGWIKRAVDCERFTREVLS
ncbi:MAG: glycosyl hydrolase 108 family protein [Desulfocurvibacter africanus]